MKEKRKVILISIIGVVALLLMIVGATYAWFSTQIAGSGPEINVTTATMGPLTYTGSEITAEGVLPGWISEDSDLTIEGIVTGNEEVSYYCIMENTGGVTDVEYRISSDGENDSSNGIWTSITEEPIITGSINSTNNSDTYKISVRFKETGKEQNDQQNETLSVNVTCEIGSGIKISNQILADNQNVSERTTFDAAFTTSNKGNTIYKQDFVQDEQNYTTYYFAGQVLNNYVKFGQNSNGQDLYWRIVRINEDGSVRLIYAGTSATDTAGYINTSLAFNTNYDNSAYVGYMYQISGENSDSGVSQTETIQHGNATSSNIKKELDTWYTNNLSEEDGYISKTAVYCNDRTVTDGTWATSGTIYYAAYIRLHRDLANYTPTYACAESKDRFTVSKFTGNGFLTKPIGLITADEVSYAGGLWVTNNPTYYMAENAKSGPNYWLTMSPCNFDNSSARVCGVGGLHYTGDLGNGNRVTVPGGARPVINLKSCVNWSDGDGTSSDPYTVQVSDSCSVKEN